MSAFQSIFAPCLAIVAAAGVELAWDTPPEADQVACWDVLRGGQVVATVTTPGVTLGLPPGEVSVISLVARNDSGSSPPSTPLIIYQPPDGAAGVQYSADLVTWRDTNFPAARFFRARLQPTLPQK